MGLKGPCGGPEYLWVGGDCNKSGKTVSKPVKESY